VRRRLLEQIDSLQRRALALKCELSSPRGAQLNDCGVGIVCIAGLVAAAFVAWGARQDLSIDLGRLAWPSHVLEKVAHAVRLLHVSRLHSGTGRVAPQLGIAGARPEFRLGFE